MASRWGALVGAVVLTACSTMPGTVQPVADASRTPPAEASPTSDSPPAATPPLPPRPSPDHPPSPTDVPSPTDTATSVVSPTAPAATPEPAPSTAAPTPGPTPTPTSSSTGAGSHPPTEPFRATVSEVVGHPAEGRMTGVSWREGCPVPLEDLRYLAMSHVDLDGRVRTGELVVRADVVEPVLAGLRRMYEVGFPIEQMRLVDDFGGDDDASMRADNTSAFNCRYVAGTSRWSNHAYGTAIDVNPLRNPYVRGGEVDPPEGAAYADRGDRRPGMLHPGTPEVAAWTGQGWDWGGTWSSGQDYQHFSATGG